MHAHGAVFAEVKVGAELGDPRHSSGRCLRRRPGDQSTTVRSQYYGGMISAYHSPCISTRDGSSLRPPMNPNLGEYHVPVNADVPSLEAILIDEYDHTSTRSA